MKSSHKEKYPGLFDCLNSTELDDVAYELYFDEEFNKPMKDNNMDNYHWWSQEGFVNSMGTEEKRKYYEQATIILRSLKINKIQNETEI